ncbi:hypothetical protein [Kineococcus rhizosphaerae]|uniref:DUF4190 domain-containing protein n=1 Tax=Kineococcus rhizosphaerae TaxID=559628 RepID=A0A2T0R0N3_9ACTN|nr:hypothetical protein [Kineococcus rhizosphaerae]PRY12872.1 hypothetical protein CLV37_10957 [Kineococcus rhizosphaerae]
MSDSGQGEGQRSWWEKPDPEQAPQDPYAAGQGPGTGDAHDPYRTGGADDATRANPAQTPPTESLPRYGEQQQSWSSSSPSGQPYGEQPGQPYGQQPGGQYGTQYGAQQNQQYPDQRYANQQYTDQYGNQQYGNQQYGYAGQQPPVAPMAHAVLWTAVGGLALTLLTAGTLGWIASIVSLALTPGARRDIVAANGAKRGLGYLLAGKICAWVNIGLVVLGVVVLGIVIAVAASNGGFDSGSTFDTGGVDVLFRR